MGLDTVGHDYVAASDYGVVAYRLRKDGVVDARRVLLAFDQHERSAVAAEGHDVGTLRRTVDIDRILLDPQRSTMYAATCLLTHSSGVSTTHCRRSSSNMSVRPAASRRARSLIGGRLSSGILFIWVWNKLIIFTPTNVLKNVDTVCIPFDSIYMK